ncbi:DUF2470 domain-containing protein [Nocardioides marmoriginsengisoli]|uniref:DUF2470 domain-containing protein n=1 Tax=Nocardioides marmoriginsengisoli TaxID=661483 RepID=A0A3N0CCK3_9ACTN|nr:DUF2470 domain-containing protein [Nocardioides marmoriginsengisoli]RNL60723.1 DUF2470 domain-containing protein [Nocardioides marmoriginsengisoli]
MSTFSAEVVGAVLAHMNDDHRDDSLRIVQAFARPDATAARMTGLDGEAGTWQVTLSGAEEEVRVPWPAAPITERAAIRREVVALHDEACAKLGIAPPAH